jgi:hypothetical protein
VLCEVLTAVTRCFGASLNGPLRCLVLAEGEGFEPSRRCYRLRDFQSRALGQAMRPFQRRRGWDSNPRRLDTSPLFESGTFNHSDTSPGGSIPITLHAAFCP